MINARTLHTYKPAAANRDGAFARVFSCCRIMLTARPAAPAARPATLAARPATLAARPATLAACPATLAARPATLAACPATLTARPAAPAACLFTTRGTSLRYSRHVSSLPAARAGAHVYPAGNLFAHIFNFL